MGSCGHCEGQERVMGVSSGSPGLLWVFLVRAGCVSTECLLQAAVPAQHREQLRAVWLPRAELQRHCCMDSTQQGTGQASLGSSRKAAEPSVPPIIYMHCLHLTALHPMRSAFHFQSFLQFTDFYFLLVIFVVYPFVFSVGLP